MSTSTFQTGSVSPTLHIFLHIDGKLHSPYVKLQFNLDINKQKRLRVEIQIERIYVRNAELEVG